MNWYLVEKFFIVDYSESVLHTRLYDRRRQGTGEVTSVRVLVRWYRGVPRGDEGRSRDGEYDTPSKFDCR